MQGPWLLFLIQSNILISFYITAGLAFFMEAVGEGFSFWKIFSFLLLVWQVYTADRYFIHPEDRHSTPQNLDRLRFIRRHKKIFGFLLLFFGFLQALPAWFSPRCLLGYGVGILLSLFYICKFPLLNFRIKQIPYIKAFYVPMVCMLTYGAYLQSPRLLLLNWKLALAFYLLMLCNTALFDLKDCENDRKAGIKTLANTLKPSQLLRGTILFSVLLAWVLSFVGENPWRIPLVWSFLLYAIFIAGLLRTRQVSYFFVILDTTAALPLAVYALQFIAACF